MDNTIEQRNSIEDLSTINWGGKIKSAIVEKGEWELCPRVDTDHGSKRVARAIYAKDCGKDDDLPAVNSLYAAL